MILPRKISQISPGFSLVELLVVLAILAILGVVTAPVIGSLAGAQNSARMGGEVQTCLELARAEAMARNTFVWVGFTNSTDSGVSVLRVGVAAAKDGTTNAASDNLFPLVKPLKLKGGRISADSQAQDKGAEVTALVREMSGGVNPVNPLTPRSGDKEGISSLQIASHTYENTITFTPQGEALLSGGPTSRSTLDAFLVVYLQRLQGETGSSDFSAVLINGASGGAQLVRPR